MSHVRKDPADAQNTANVSASIHKPMVEPKKSVEELNLEKLEREVEQLKKAAEKPDHEIEKLKAEIKQLNRPHKTPQFWLSICTTVFSAAAVAGTIAGILIQSTWAKWELAESQKTAREEYQKIESAKSDFTRNTRR